MIDSFDIIIVLVLLVLSFLPSLLINKQRKEKQKSTQFSQLTVKIERFELSNTPHDEGSSTFRMTIV